MGHFTRGLFEHQALFGQREIDPACNRLTGEPVVVAVRIVAEQREAEAVFAARGSVATAGIAARLGEDGHDVFNEADRLFGFGTFDFNWDEPRFALKLDLQFGLPVGHWGENEVIKFHECLVRECEASLGRHVTRDAVGVESLDHDALAVAAGLEVHVSREDFDLGESGFCGEGGHRAAAAEHHAEQKPSDFLGGGGQDEIHALID